MRFWANTPISGPLLQERALIYAQSVGNDSFKASNGWLEKFKGRHHVKWARLHGEGGSADTSQKAQQRMQQLKQICAEYAEEDIFNMDETGIFYRMMPSSSLLHPKEDPKECRGTKQEKSRITAVVCSNATGTQKLPLLVIGRSKRPKVRACLCALQFSKNHCVIVCVPYASFSLVGG
jgi:hypothetical protein